MKDIFIDNNIASRFATAKDPEYKKIIKWLLKFDKSISLENNAHLVLSNKILKEYYDSSRNARSATSIIAIIDIMTKDGRNRKSPKENYNFYSNNEIKEFRNTYFTNNIKKRFTNQFRNERNRDLDHLPIILMSDRKKALIIDNEFRNLVNEFPGFNAVAENRPREEFYS